MKRETAGNNIKVPVLKRTHPIQQINSTILGWSPYENTTEKNLQHEKRIYGHKTLLLLFPMGPVHETNEIQPYTTTTVNTNMNSTLSKIWFKIHQLLIQKLNL